MNQSQTMEKSYLQPTNCFSKFWFLFFLVPSLTFSNPIVEIKNLDISGYPEIKMEIHSGSSFPPGEITVSERANFSSQIAKQIRITEKSENTKIDFIISIPSYQNLEERRWLLDLAQRLTQIVDTSGGTNYLHIQSNENFHLYERIRSKELITSFPFPKEKVTTKPVESWEKLLDSISVSENGNVVFLLVNFLEEWPDRIQIPEFAKKLKNKNIRLLVVSPKSLEATKLASYANGSFYSLSHSDTYAEIQQYLKNSVKPNHIVEYESPWKFSRWETNSIQVSLQSYDRQIQLETKYELSFFSALYNEFKNPFVFFPIVLFFIALCLSALYYLRGFDSKKETIPLPVLGPSSELKEEEAVYSLVYGETIERANRDREIAYRIREPLPLSGETYGFAVLIKRDTSGATEKKPIQVQEFKIGRSEKNHLVLSDPTVSLSHAKIKNVKGKYILFDCASDSGVYLNGKKLLRPKALYDLDEIQFGKTVYSFRGR